MVKRLALLLCAVTGIGCGKTRDLRGAGRLQVPAPLDSIQVDESPDRIVFSWSNVINSFFWMGSNTPIGAVLAVAEGAPDADGQDLRQAAEAVAGKRCGAARAEGACIYEVNTHVEPSWLLSVEDPARRVAMAYRVFQRDASRNQAEAVLRAALASYQPAANAGEVFAGIRERPRKDEQTAARREERMLAWFDRKGLPRPRLEETVRHEDCAYFWSRGFRSSLEFACLIGSRGIGDPVPERPNSDEVTVVEYRQFRDRWQLVRPGQELDLNLAPWSGFAHERFDAERTYYFLTVFRYLLYEGVGTETNHEPHFLDALWAVRGQWREEFGRRFAR